MQIALASILYYFNFDYSKEWFPTLTDRSDHIYIIRCGIMIFWFWVMPLLPSFLMVLSCNQSEFVRLRIIANHEKEQIWTLCHYIWIVIIVRKSLPLQSERIVVEKDEFYEVIWEPQSPLTSIHCLQIFAILLAS